MSVCEREKIGKLAQMSIVHRVQLFMAFEVHIRINGPLSLLRMYAILNMYALHIQYWDLKEVILKLVQ